MKGDRRDVKSRSREHCKGRRACYFGFRRLCLVRVPLANNTDNLLGMIGLDGEGKVNGMKVERLAVVIDPPVTQIGIAGSGLTRP